MAGSGVCTCTAPRISSHRLLHRLPGLLHLPGVLETLRQRQRRRVVGALAEQKRDLLVTPRGQIEVHLVGRARIMPGFHTASKPDAL